MIGIGKMILLQIRVNTLPRTNRSLV